MNDNQQMKLNDFGNDELNNIYNGLDLKTKKEIDDIKNLNIDANKKMKIITMLLKDIADEDLKEVYNSLPQKEKDKLDVLKIRDRLSLLKQIAKSKILTKTKTQQPVVVDLPRTPDFSPPKNEERDAPEELLKEDIDVEIDFNASNNEIRNKVELTDLKQSQKNLQKDFRIKLTFVCLSKNN